MKDSKLGSSIAISCIKSMSSCTEEIVSFVTLKSSDKRLDLGKGYSPGERALRRRGRRMSGARARARPCAPPGFVGEHPRTLRAARLSGHLKLNG